MISMIPPPSTSIEEKFSFWLEQLRRFGEVREQGNGSFKACCPCHDDTNPSLETCIGEKGIIAYCHVCKFKSREQFAVLCHRIGVTLHWTFKPDTTGTSFRIAGEWIYRDEFGDPIFRVIREDLGKLASNGKPAKKFSQQPPDGKGGWIREKGAMKGVRVVPYRLEHLWLSRGVVLIVEGEKACDAAAELGYVSTCNAGGGGKWTDKHSEFLKGRDVVILPDNDKPGREHARITTDSLMRIGAASVRVAILPGLPPAGDIIDFLNSGGTKEQIQQAIDKAKPIEEALSAADEKQPKGDAPSAAAEGDDGPTSMEIADSFIALYHGHPERPTLAYHRKSFFEYVGTHYRPVEDEDLRCLLTSHIDEMTGSMSMNRLASVMQCLKARTLVPSITEPSSWICESPRTGEFIAMKNGILDLSRVLAGEKNVLIPHSPNWFSPVCLPYEFNPDAECPLWFDVLCKSLDGDFDLTCLLQEWFGYLLAKGTHQQKFAILYGEGGTGKSTTCAALQAMLGYLNVSSVSLEDLGSRFHLYRTLGKLANISAETEEINKVAEGKLKALTSGDPVPFEEKGKPIFDATPTARLIFAMNNLPRFTDRSSGLWRRLILIPFDRVIPEAERVRGMDKAEWWVQQGEMPGILNWAIEGLKRLRVMGFTNPARCQGLIESYRRESNPARAFLLRNYREEPAGYVVTKDVYQAYRNECLRSGTQPLHEANFGKEIKRTFPGTVSKRKRVEDGLAYCYEGICEGPSEAESAEEVLP